MSDKPGPKFKVGEWVRVSLPWWKGTKYDNRHGVVRRVYEKSNVPYYLAPYYTYRVVLRGNKQGYEYHEEYLHRPDEHRPFTDAAVLLAKSVLEGNTDLAFMLVDEILEHSKRGTTS